MYCYNGAQRYEQFLQVGRLYLFDLAWFSSLPSTSVSSVFMVLYLTFFNLPRPAATATATAATAATATA